MPTQLAFLFLYPMSPSNTNKGVSKLIYPNLTHGECIKNNHKALKNNTTWNCRPIRAYQMWRKHLYIDVAFSQIHKIMVNIFGPITSELGNSYLKPRFHVPIVVYNSSLFNFSLDGIGVVA